jgi:hypothetical protein
MDKTEQEVIDEVKGQFQLSKRYLDTIHLRMNDQESLYRSWIDSTTYPHSARVFDPRVFRAIETITPKLVANEPTGSFYPVEKGDTATVQILNALIKYDWRRAEMFPKLTTFVKSMLIFGTGFGLVYWDYRETKKKRPIPQEVNGTYVWNPSSSEEISVTEFDGPNFEPLNIYDCFPDPNCTSIKDMRWFVYRTFKTVDELKNENFIRGNNYYKNLDLLEMRVKDKGGRTSDALTSDLEYREHRRTMLSTQEYRGADVANPEFVVLRRFVKNGWVDIVPEYNICIRDTDNPYFHGELPIVYGVDYIYPGELYGIGEIEPVDRLQRAINAVLNQRLDNVQLVLRNMWKVRKNSGVDMHTLISSPGNIVTTDDMTAVEPFVVPDVTGNTFVGTMNYLTAAFQNGTGITDYTMGINTSANVATDTATGVKMVQQEANAQVKLKIQLFYKMVVERIVNQWKDLRIQFTTEEQKLRIIGKDEVQNLLKNTDLAKMSTEGEMVAPGDMETPRRVSVSKDQGFAFLSVYPEDIQPSIVGDFDFIANISSEVTSDPESLVQNFFLALDRISTPDWIKGLNSQGKDLNYEGITSKVFDKLSIGVEKSEVVVDMPEEGGEQGANIRAQINFKDLPPTGQQQLAGQAGIDLQPQELQQMQEQMPQQPGVMPQGDIMPPVPNLPMGGLNGA